MYHVEPKCISQNVFLKMYLRYQLEWRETGQLPKGRDQLKAVVIQNNVYVTGGNWYEGVDPNSLAEILRWDPSTDSWQQVGNLTKARKSHAAVTIPSAFIESECSSMFL